MLRTSYEEFDSRTSGYGLGAEDPIPVQIDFVHHAAMPEHGLAASWEMSFETTQSGTGLAPGVATEIAEAMGKFFGITCER